MKTIIKYFSKPTSQDIAKQELEEAQRQLLQAQTVMEFNQSMVTYHKNRISRLKLYVTTEGVK